MVWLVQSTNLSPKGQKSSFPPSDTRCLATIPPCASIRKRSSGSSGLWSLGFWSYLKGPFWSKYPNLKNISPTFPLFPWIFLKSPELPFPSLFSPPFGGKILRRFFRVGGSYLDQTNCGAEVPGLRSGAQCHQKTSNRCPRPSWPWKSKG